VSTSWQSPNVSHTHWVQMLGSTTLWLIVACSSGATSFTDWRNA